MKIAASIALALVALCQLSGCDRADPGGSATLITELPEQLDANCRDGRAKIYDQCADQRVLFSNGLERASEEDKLVLVSYGAEWCIWCHVFKSYIQGKYGEFEYTYGERGNAEKWTDTIFERAKTDVVSEASALREFVAKNFVVVHIDYEYAPGSDDVLIDSGAAEHFQNWVPFIFVVDRDGKYVGQVSHDDVEIRRDTDDWYRGYDRVKLISIFEQLISDAQ